MYGSILYNCWSALVGFTVYFVLALQNQFASPISIILGSVLAAISAFLLMFPIRYLLHFILFTPEQIEVVVDEYEQNETGEMNAQDQAMLNRTNIVEFEDESTEDIANVVRTMMHQDSESRTAS